MIINGLAVSRQRVTPSSPISFGGSRSPPHSVPTPTGSYEPEGDSPMASAGRWINQAWFGCFL